MSPNELRGAPGQRAPRHDRAPTKETDPHLAFKVARALMTLPPDVVAALIGLLPDPAAEAELRGQLYREAYEAGLAEGWRRGYELGARLMEADWPRVIRGLVDGDPSLAELELIRWGPGGRECFGGPRPDDRFPRMEAAS